MDFRHDQATYKEFPQELKPYLQSTFNSSIHKKNVSEVLTVSCLSQYFEWAKQHPTLIRSSPLLRQINEIATQTEDKYLAQGALINKISNVSLPVLGQPKDEDMEFLLDEIEKLKIGIIDVSGFLLNTKTTELLLSRSKEVEPALRNLHIFENGPYQNEYTREQEDAFVWLIQKGNSIKDLSLVFTIQNVEEFKKGFEVLKLLNYPNIIKDFFYKPLDILPLLRMAILKVLDTQTLSTFFKKTDDVSVHEIALYKALLEKKEDNGIEEVIKRLVTINFYSIPFGLFIPTLSNLDVNDKIRIFSLPDPKTKLPFFGFMAFKQNRSLVETEFCQDQFKELSGNTLDLSKNYGSRIIRVPTTGQELIESLKIELKMGFIYEFINYFYFLQLNDKQDEIYKAIGSDLIMQGLSQDKLTLINPYFFLLATPLLLRIAKEEDGLSKIKSLLTFQASKIMMPFLKELSNIEGGPTLVKEILSNKNYKGETLLHQEIDEEVENDILNGLKLTDEQIVELLIIRDSSGDIPLLNKNTYFTNFLIQLNKKENGRDLVTKVISKCYSRSQSWENKLLTEAIKKINLTNEQLLQIFSTHLDDYKDYTISTFPNDPIRAALFPLLINFNNDELNAFFSHTNRYGHTPLVVYLRESIPYLEKILADVDGPTKVKKILNTQNTWRNLFDKLSNILIMIPILEKLQLSSQVIFSLFTSSTPIILYKEALPLLRQLNSAQLASAISNQFNQKTFSNKNFIEFIKGLKDCFELHDLIQIFTLKEEGKTIFNNKVMGMEIDQKLLLELFGINFDLRSVAKLKNMDWDTYRDVDVLREDDLLQKIYTWLEDKTGAEKARALLFPFLLGYTDNVYKNLQELSRNERKAFFDLLRDPLYKIPFVTSSYIMNPGHMQEKVQTNIKVPEPISMRDVNFVGVEKKIAMKLKKPSIVLFLTSSTEPSMMG